MIGSELGPYRITAKLGEGGMGEVWRAHDGRLDREVAIKVLPEAFAEDPERLSRFEREAKVLASLNHQNIAGIYEVGRAPLSSSKASGSSREISAERQDEDREVHFLAMELVEGETLDQAMERGPIAIDSSLKIALQIAGALEVAHDRGIVHRDLKPANIKLTPQGEVKVLDFGLAKAGSSHTGAPYDLSISPTLTAQMTQAGVILGTAAYMSPEQARGKDVDKRADIWAFGVILYEMLSGSEAFSGDTVTDLIAAVVTKEPDPSRLPANLPRRVHSLIARCLRKESHERLRDIGDARLEISEVLENPGSMGGKASTAAGPSRSRGNGVLLVVAFVAALVAGSATFWLVAPEPDGDVSVARLEFRTPQPIDYSGIPHVPLTISPDGRRIVLSLTDQSRPGLYLRELDSFETVPLPGTEDGRTPFFSPDGQSIGFVARNEIRRLPLDGGLPVTVTTFSGLVAGATWTADDSIVYVLDFERILRVPANGGSETEVPLDASGLRIAWPTVLPGGRWVLVQISGELDGQPGPHVGAIGLETGEVRRIIDGSGPLFADTGHLVWVKNETLHAAAFDAERLELVGPRAALDVTFSMTNDGAPRLAISRAGHLAYTLRDEGETVLQWVDQRGRLETIAEFDSSLSMPKLSPDGRQVAFSTEGSLMIFDLERKTNRDLFEERIGLAYMAWTPDGSRIAYGSNREGPFKIYVRNVDGSGVEERLFDTEFSAIPMSFSPKGETLLFYKVTSETARDIWYQTAGEEPRPLLATRANERAPIFSPDGTLFAYVSDKEGRDDVYVRRFPDDGAAWKVSTEGGVEPTWGPDGTDLFFRVDDQFMVAKILDDDGEVRPGLPEFLFRGQFRSSEWGNPAYQVSPDGQRFLVFRSSASRIDEIRIVLNWFEELNRVAPRS